MPFSSSLWYTLASMMLETCWYKYFRYEIRWSIVIRNRDQELNVEVKLPCVKCHEQNMFFFFYNKLDIGSKIQCILTDVLYCILEVRFKFRRTTFIQRNRTVPVRQRIKQRNEKEKIEFVSKNKGFLNSIIFLSWNEKQDN